MMPFKASLPNPNQVFHMQWISVSSIGSPATADSEICAFPGGTVRKLLTIGRSRQDRHPPISPILRILVCESGFSCIGALISCQAVAAPPPLGLGSCTTMDLRPPHWIAIATTHNPNYPVYNVSRILGMPFSFGTVCHTLAILLRLSCSPALHTLSPTDSRCFYD